MRILSVDDDDDNLLLVARMAQSRHHEVVTAHNGVEALEQLNAGSFDLIISDILMPEMDGFRLCRLVKADARFMSVPFIFYTATYTAKEDEELAVALGASRFVVKPADRDEFLAIIENAVNESAAGTIPVPAAHPDEGGTSLLYNARLVRKLERKIEQLEAARAELSRSEEQLRLMWDASMDGMVLCDGNGIILRANRAFAEMIGTASESLAGRTVPPCRDEGGVNLLAPGPDLIRSGAWESHCRGTLDSAAGVAVHVEVSRAVVGLPLGQQALFSVVRDITARLRLEQEQAVMQNQLYQTQKLEAVGRVAGSVAHDFNNVLTVINGYIDLLLSGIPQQDPSRVAAEQIRQAGQRAADLTRGLLGFSRKQIARPKALELNRIVEDVTPLLTRLLGETVTLSTRYLAQPVVYADALQLEQVLMNLTVNARDAMPGGGNVRIETNVAGGKQSDGAPSESRAGNWAVLTVRDEGEGITEEALPHIFEPFYTTKTSAKGTGLGLSIVENIVQQTGGRIEIESSPGQGATFRVYLPAMDGTSREPEPEPARASVTKRTSGDETVMVIEDQDFVRGYVQHALLAYGYRVVPASGVNSAMRVVESAQQRPDIILTDVVMPDGNGIDLADRIRDHWPGIPILFMSGYMEQAPEIAGGKQSAPLEFIQKPFTADQLAAKIREMLQHRDQAIAAGRW